MSEEEVRTLIIAAIKEVLAELIAKAHCNGRDEITTLDLQNVLEELV